MEEYTMSLHAKNIFNLDLKRMEIDNTVKDFKKQYKKLQDEIDELINKNKDSFVIIQIEQLKFNIDTPDESYPYFIMIHQISEQQSKIIDEMLKIQKINNDNHDLLREYISDMIKKYTNNPKKEISTDNLPWHLKY
jgi:hypothetical protein